MRAPSEPAADTRTPLPDDPAQKTLLRYVCECAEELRTALRTVDKSADCEVVPAADLGVPYDAVRLAGGFPTGCFVQWKCETPVVPIDTTVNIDTSSIFWLDGSLTGRFTDRELHCLRDRIDHDSSYGWNFDRGNHFIILARRRSDGREALVLHSNENEFKNQYNGLFPTPGNWYEDSVVSSGPAAIRLLVGPKAQLFAQMAKMLEEFNIVRHRFMATMLAGSAVMIAAEDHRHHYYMPTPSSVAIGCYVVKPMDWVPVFSTLGAPLSIFKAVQGGLNEVTLAGKGERLLVPHGWGMGTTQPLVVERDALSLSVNGIKYPLELGPSLLEHPDVSARDFGSPDRFFKAIEHHTPGEAVEHLDQVASYSRFGYRVHLSH